jgi:tetratricopeptide (TPR) repeat protein
MTSARQLLWGVFLATSIGLGSAPAQAAESAEALIQRGIALRTRGNDFEALPLFQRAHELSPTPRASAQLGLVEQALGRWPEAETHVAKALEARRDSWVEKNRKVLTQSLETIRQQIAVIEISGEPRGAAVSINGRGLGQLPLPAPVRVGAGYIEIELSADSYLPAKRTMTVTGAKAYQLFVKLEKPALAPSAPPPPVLVTPAQPPPAAPERSSGRGLRIAGLAVGAAGLLAIANGVRLSVRVADLNKSVMSNDPDGVADGKAAARDQWISYGIGAAALGGAGVLYYLGLTKDEESNAVAIAPLPGGAMGTARWRF